MSATTTASDHTRRRLWRWLLLLHRYLGMALGVLVLAWCVSGIVMMYVPYPSLGLEARLAGLAPLETGRCCAAIPDGRDAVMSVGDHVVEMLAGRPVLRFTLSNGERHVFDLETGRAIAATDSAMQAGLEFAHHQGWPEPRFAGHVARDQWTVQGRFDAHRPLHLFRDADGREWYVSDRTGEVVQLTEASERFWNRLGAVVHWLYPTVLRQHTAVWSQVVIVLTLAALFLTVTGIVVGIRQYRAGNGGGLSPYRGWLAWHHYGGLAFGLLTLTWLFSGLLSMNPWGLLESRSFAGEIRAVNGGRAALSEVVSRLDTLMPELPAGTMRLESAYWLDRPEYLARGRAGEIRRLGLTGAPAPIDSVEAAVAARRLRPDVSPERIELLEREDAYYYRHHATRELPVIRIGYQDGERFYLSPATGRVLLAVDGNARAGRWLFAALHRGDFHSAVRSRPIWDFMMLAALAGVIVGVGAGAWLGMRRPLRRRAGSRTG